jgi:hypothetical protein
MAWDGQEATRFSLGTGQLAQKGKDNLKDALKLTIRSSISLMRLSACSLYAKSPSFLHALCEMPNEEDNPTTGMYTFEYEGARHRQFQGVPALLLFEVAGDSAYFTSAHSHNSR